MPASKDEVAAFLAAEFPQSLCVVEAVGDRGATVSHRVGPAELRPGGTVSGPVLMGVADVALYVALLGEIDSLRARLQHMLDWRIQVGRHHFWRRPGARA